MRIEQLYVSVPSLLPSIQQMDLFAQRTEPAFYD